MPYGCREKAYKRNENRVRGEIIYYTILLERIIDSYIARHFFPDTESDKFHEVKKFLIADRMEFSKKIEVFKEILMIECVTKEVFNQQYPRFGDDFKEIGNTRNDFAHGLSLMPPNKDLNKWEIILYKYRKEQPEPYSKEKIKECLEKIFKYIDRFSEGGTHVQIGK